MKKSTQRFGRLDGLRAVAIIWVFIYHFTEFWTPAGRGSDLMPYDAQLSFLPLAAVGDLGVILFFLISGQVILMTLERTQNAMDFFIKRVARLWPTLLICGTLTFLIASWIGPEEVQVSVQEYLISLLILPPDKIGPLMGASDWQWLDGAYWSLWVEIRFYALIGIIFYLFNAWWLRLWLVFSFGCLFVKLLAHFTDLPALEPIGSLLIYDYVPYFSLGILAHLRENPAHKRWIGWAVVAVIFHIMIIGFLAEGMGIQSVEYWMGLLLVLCLYGRAVFRSRETKWLNKLSGIGRASYSFYLLHQVIGISLLVAIGKYFTPEISMILLIPLFFALVWVSKIIFNKFEQPMNRFIVSKFTSPQT